MFRNPCKKCIVSIVCSEECEGRSQFNRRRDRLHSLAIEWFMVIVILVTFGLLFLEQLVKL